MGEEQRLEHPALTKLKSIVEDKTVCFLAPGPSVGGIGDYLWDFPSDVVWLAHNVFLPVEEILDPIGRKLDIVYVSCRQVIGSGYGQKYVDFLARDHGILLTTTGGIEKFDECIPGLMNERREKVISFFFGDGFPRGNSFDVIEMDHRCHYVFSFIPIFLALLKANVRRIICFGLDGGRTSPEKQWYYGVFEDYPQAWFHGMPGEYAGELGYLHQEWLGLVERALGDKKLSERIINCSPHSKINSFTKIDYPDLAKLFEEGRIECQEPSPSSSPA